MRPLTGLAIAALTFMAGCKIEQTPARFLDREDAVEVGRREAVAELRDRLLATVRAIDRGNPTEALIALSPDDDVYILGPVAGFSVTGADQLGTIVHSLVRGPTALAISDLEVVAGEGGGSAWFRARLDLPGVVPEGRAVRFTGVYQLDAGLWKLVQAHLSMPFSEPSPADSSSRNESVEDSRAGG